MLAGRAWGRVIAASAVLAGTYAAMLNPGLAQAIPDVEWGLADLATWTAEGAVGLSGKIMT